MKLLVAWNFIAGNTNSISEFVLRTFAETWVEPVLKQLLKLEQYYETDEHITALAGKAGEVEGLRMGL